MKTAVDFLIERIKESLNNGDIDFTLYEFEKYVELIAKAKETKQIIDAYNHGCLDTLNDEMKQGKQYYNETYKQ